MVPADWPSIALLNHTFRVHLAGTLKLAEARTVLVRSAPLAIAGEELMATTTATMIEQTAISRRFLDGREFEGLTRGP